MNEIERAVDAVLKHHGTTRADYTDEEWCEGVAALEVAIAAMRGEPVGWQPIETAPKDGRKLILCRSDGKGGYADYPETFYWDGDWYAEIDGASVTTKHTHWMPLPTPPNGGSDAE